MTPKGNSRPSPETPPKVIKPGSFNNPVTRSTIRSSKAVDGKPIKSSATQVICSHCNTEAGVRAMSQSELNQCSMLIYQENGILTALCVFCHKLVSCFKVAP